MDIEQAGREALARVNAVIQQSYINAHMEVRADFNRARMYLATLFVPEDYGVQPEDKEGVYFPYQEFVMPDGTSVKRYKFPDTFAEFEKQKHDL